MTNPVEMAWLQDEFIEAGITPDVQDVYTQEFFMNVRLRVDGYDVMYRRPGPSEFRPKAFIGVLHRDTGVLRLRGPAQEGAGVVRLDIKPELTDIVRFYISVEDGSARSLYLPLITWSR